MPCKRLHKFYGTKVYHLTLTGSQASKPSYSQADSISSLRRSFDHRSYSQRRIRSVLALKKHGGVKRPSFLLPHQVLQVSLRFRELGLPINLVDGHHEGAFAALVGRQKLGQTFGTVWK